MRPVRPYRQAAHAPAVASATDSVSDIATALDCQSWPGSAATTAAAMGTATAARPPPTRRPIASEARRPVMTGTSAPARRLTTSPIRPSGPATSEIAAMTIGKPGGCWNDGIAVAVQERLAQRPEGVVDVPERVLAVQPVEAVRRDEDGRGHEHEQARRDPREPDRRTVRHDSGTADHPRIILDTVALTAVAQREMPCRGPAPADSRSLRPAGALALVAVIVGACSGTSPSTGPVSLRLQVSMTPEELASFQPAIQAVDAAHPEFTVQLENVPQDSETQKITTEVAADDLPDVLRVTGLQRPAVDPPRRVPRPDRTGRRRPGST